MNGYIAQLPILLSELQLLITLNKNKRIINESIQCFAYLFDFNPLLVTELKKTTTQVLLREGLNSESAATRNNVIQIAYFIKDNNLVLLLNDNWFYCLIQLINNSIPEAQRKKMQTICYSIAKEHKKYAQFKEYLLPGIVFIELNIKANKQSIKELIQLIDIIKVIAQNSKKYNSKEEKEVFAKSFIESSNIIALLSEILSNVVYQKNITQAMITKSESDEVILTIINILSIFSRQTNQSADYIIHLDILTIVNEIMINDPQLIFSHKYPLKLLLNLFSNNKSIGKTEEKLLSNENEKQYSSFSNSLLNIVQSIHHIQHSPPSVLNTIIRLLEIYFVSKKDSSIGIQYAFAAEIVSLILSSKCYKYYSNVIEFLEHILDHSLKQFKTIILREGIVNQLKNIEYPSINDTIRPQLSFPSLFTNSIRFQVPQVTVSNEIINNIKVKVENFFKVFGEAFDEDQESKKRLEDLIQIKNQLIILKDNDDIIMEAIDLLINEKQNPLTPYEINKSQIILAICDYFDQNIKRIINTDQYQTKLFAFRCERNDKIHHKTSAIIKHFLFNENKLQLFIQTLNNQLAKVKTLPLTEPITPQGKKIAKIYLIYNKKIFDSIQSEMENLGDFAADLTKFHSNYSLIQKYYFEFEEKDKVKTIYDMLYHHSHVDISLINNESCFIPKIVLYYDNDKEEEVVISKDETFKDALLKIVIKQKIGVDTPDVWDSEIILRFGLLYDIKEDTNNDLIITKQNQKEQTRLMCSHSVNFNYLTPSHSDLASIRYYQFELAYYKNIIFNKGIYINKEACPILYLLSLVNYGVRCFNEECKAINEIKMQNNNLTSIIIQQLSKGDVVIMNKIPKWMKLLCSSINNLTSFDSRLLLFKLVFHISRSYPNFQSMIKSHFIQPTTTQLNNPFFSVIKQKYIVKAQRGNEVNSVKEIIAFKEIKTYFGYIEFEFIDEIGNGQGPTLEFYSNLFAYWQSQANLWVKTSNGALYPRPCSGNEETFKQLGFMIGRAIMDNRLFDFPLSRIFYDLILERPILIDTINELDISIGKVVKELMRIAKAKQSMSNNTNDDMLHSLQYEGKTSIEDLGLYFILPGYDSILLKPQGLETQVTIKNIEEYILLLYEALFTNNFITKIKQSFIEGVNMVFNYTNLSLFTSKELEEKICGFMEEMWDKPTLEMHILPAHGYTKASPVYHHLITYLSSLSKENQKKFIQFTTGTPRLPLGGFCNLSPKLTVVKRHAEHYDNPDFFLPSVMTCQNYLKLPEYSSYDILQTKITIAMNEGANEFLLS